MAEHEPIHHHHGFTEPPVGYREREAAAHAARAVLPPKTEIESAGEEAVAVSLPDPAANDEPNALPDLNKPKQKGK